jgi:hypothetical protein
MVLESINSKSLITALIGMQFRNSNNCADENRLFIENLPVVLLDGIIIVANKPDNRICRRAFEEIFPRRYPVCHKNDKDAA